MYQSKNNYWQMIRGIAILAVTIIHCRTAASFTFGGGYYVLIRNIVNFPVSLFFFIAGYFCSYRGSAALAWVSARTKKLLVPYIVWSAIFMAVHTMSEGLLPVETYIRMIFFGQAAVPYYYILTLLLFTVMTPVLYKMVTNKIVAIILISPAIQIVGYIIQMHGVSIWSYMKYTPVWMLFYYGGMYIRQHMSVISKKVIWGVLPSLLVEILSSVLLLQIDSLSSIAFSQYRVTGFIYAAVLCGVVVAYDSTEVGTDNFLVKIGDDSFSIFWLHYAFVLGLEQVLPQNMFLPFVMVIETVVSILGSMVVAYFLRQLLKRKSWWLGL